MTRTIFLAAGLACLLHAASPADQLRGHWEAEVTGDGRSFSFLFNFNPSGNTFSGTVELPATDRSFDIKEGKISGNNISFQAFGNWTGTLAGDELRLTRGLDYGKKQYMKAHRKPGA